MLIEFNKEQLKWLIYSVGLAWANSMREETKAIRSKAKGEIAKEQLQYVKDRRNELESLLLYLQERKSKEE